MVEKNRKLQEQFAAEVAGSFHGVSSALKPIFHGVSIFVDGFTVPSSQVSFLYQCPVSYLLFYLLRAIRLIYLLYAEHSLISCLFC